MSEELGEVVELLSWALQSLSLDTLPGILRPKLSLPAVFLRTPLCRARERAGWAGPGWGWILGGCRQGPAPPEPPLATTERRTRGSARRGSSDTVRTSGRRALGPAPGSGARQARTGSVPGLAAARSLSAPSLRAMDEVLLGSLLEANCSLAPAGDVLLDGWGPPDPAGRRRAERPGRARFFPDARGSRAGLSGRSEQPDPQAPLADPRRLHPRLQVPSATPPWTRSGRAGPRARPASWWRGRAPSISTASSTTRRVSGAVPGCRNLPGVGLGGDSPEGLQVVLGASSCPAVA